MKNKKNRIEGKAAGTLIVLLTAAAAVMIFTSCEDTLMLQSYKDISREYEWKPSQYVSAGIGTEYYYYGSSCDIDGSYMIVGAKHYANGETRAYIYEYNGSWQEREEIVVGGFGGLDVGISGDYAIVGDSYNNQAFIYKRDGSNWPLLKTLTGSPGSRFGHSVSIHGSYAIVGAYYEEVSTLSNSGKAYVYYKDKEGDDNWGLLHDLQCSDSPEENLEFGYDVSISENTAIISAKKYEDHGAAYIYDKVSETQWGTGLRKEHVRLIPSNPLTNDYFGGSVSIDGDHSVVGFEGREEAVVYRKEGNSWQATKITAPVPTSGNGFGNSVAVSGDYVIVGAYSSESANDTVPSYVFECINDVYVQRPELSLPVNTVNPEFNAAVAISGGTAVVGICYDDEEGDDAGRAVVFRRTSAD